MKKLYLLTLAMLFAGFTIASAQATLKTHGLSPRQAEEDTTDFYEYAYNSLLNVGVGTVMYFEGSDSVLSGAAFSVIDQPATSTADITETEELDAKTMVAMFVPDVEGTYVITFSNNGGADTLTVNAGTYVTVDNCGLCHNTAKWDYKIDKWEETGHASMLQRGLDGIASSHYGENCISCHTTGFDEMADNDGFDDFEFVFPDTLFPGMYDSMLTKYPDAMARANIQCESCHGPGSGHYGNLLYSKMEASLDANVCAICHDEGHHDFPAQWRLSGEDAYEFDGRGFEGGHGKGYYLSDHTGQGSCAPCHNGAGYVEWVNEGRPVNSDGLPSSIEEEVELTLISCAVCHDPHDATNEHQLRFTDTQLGDGTPVTFDTYGTGTMCMQCHRSRRDAKTYASNPDNASSHFGAHHGPEADMLIGANAPDFGEGVKLASSPHAVAVVPGEDQSNACVNCHMSPDGVTETEEGIINVGGHTFNMNDAEGHDNVAACTPCHGTIGDSFKDKIYYVNGNGDLDGNGVTEGLQVEVKGLWNQLALLLPPYDTLEVSISKTDSPEIVEAAYVYFWIEEDRSWGIHNPAFAVSMLKAAIEQSGGVTSIEYPETTQPVNFALSQNYPNPFNPTTKIDFSMTNNGHVKMIVYNVLGQQVSTLLDNEMTAGSHTVDFDATNLTSGIYIYRIQINAANGTQYTAMNKMILMK